MTIAVTFKSYLQVLRKSDNMEATKLDSDVVTGLPSADVGLLVLQQEIVSVCRPALIKEHRRWES
jgi:hypothetical protein